MIGMPANDRIVFTWDGCAERLQRLGDANREAWLERLRALTLEESVQIFEDLSRGIPELDRARPAAPPPVSLLRLWRA